MNITTHVTDKNLINSRRIAQDFKKQHCIVLWSIDKLESNYGDCGMFQEAYEPDELGRPMRIYWLTKAAVLLLIGGYRGSRVGAMKKHYAEKLVTVGKALI